MMYIVPILLKLVMFRNHVVQQNLLLEKVLEKERWFYNGVIKMNK